jgi:imidazoleglycerol-phosphate dehydratase
MDSPDDILKKVTKIQEEGGYSDQQMAEKIDISRPLYQRTRTSKIPIGGSFLKGAMKLLAPQPAAGRKASITRQTKETSIKLELDVDGSGRWQINTGLRMFDHLLSQLARHGLFNIKLAAAGDDPHHLIEDVAICLGRAFSEALGERRGIVRMADIRVPMDEALASVAVDISGRGYAVLDLHFGGGDMPDFPVDLLRHFMESFAIEARLNLHAAVLYGSNDHHKAEALFKALGRALDAATRIDERISSEVPSTKGMLAK